MGSRYLAGWPTKMGQLFGLVNDPVDRATLAMGSNIESEAGGGAAAPASLPLKSEDASNDIQSLFASIQHQALDLQCQFTKAVTDWTVALNVLTTRASTMDPLLNEAVKGAKESQRTVDHLTALNKEFKIKSANAERDLLHYRPLALRLEDEVRVAKDQIEEQARRIRALESENAATVGEYNDLFQKLASVEARNQRLTEENIAYLQKLSDTDSTTQTLLRNAAQLNSDLASTSTALERAEKEAANLAHKLTTENEELKRAQANLDATKAQMQTLKKESEAQLREAEERASHATEGLVAKDKRIYDLEVKLASVNSKNDFLERSVQRMREDVRRHLDHIGTIEASNSTRSRATIPQRTRNRRGPKPNRRRIHRRRRPRAGRRNCARFLPSQGVGFAVRRGPWCGPRAVRRSTAAAEHLDIQIANLFAQGVAVDPQ